LFVVLLDGRLARLYPERWRVSTNRQVSEERFVREVRG